jgi:hypothetical protein
MEPSRIVCPGYDDTSRIKTAPVNSPQQPTDTPFDKKREHVSATDPDVERDPKELGEAFS